MAVVESKNWIVFCLILLVSTTCFSQDSLTICASQKSDIPAGYSVLSISPDLNACTPPKQRMFATKSKSQNFWMCDVDGVGAPPGYVIVEENKLLFCGCRLVTRDANGNASCVKFPGQSEGWPLVLARKLQ